MEDLHSGKVALFKVAMVDTNHAFHGSIHRWLDAQSELVWASCPITENGLIRVLSQPNYRGGVKSPMEVMDILAGMKASEPWRHVFWPDDFSVNEPGALFPERIIGSKQVTDAYLAGLALKNGGDWLPTKAELRGSRFREEQKH